jgi:hypothetical protein
MSAKYDVIGINYAELRKPDERIVQIIESALGSAQTVLNVGAGTGSYEPTDRSVIAVEPSREMIRKRNPAAAEAIQACAQDLPFDDRERPLPTLCGLSVQSCERPLLTQSGHGRSQFLGGVSSRIPTISLIIWPKQCSERYLFGDPGFPRNPRLRFEEASRWA